jgi:hypothetical protein
VSSRSCNQHDLSSLSSHCSKNQETPTDYIRAPPSNLWYATIMRILARIERRRCFNLIVVTPTLRRTVPSIQEQCVYLAGLLSRDRHHKTATWTMGAYHTGLLGFVLPPMPTQHAATCQVWNLVCSAARATGHLHRRNVRSSWHRRHAVIPADELYSHHICILEGVSACSHHHDSYC